MMVGKHDVLSYLLDHGPLLVTNLFATVGGALGLVALLFTRRAALSDRSAVVIASVETGPGNLIVKVANVGKRFALEIALSADDWATCVSYGGMAAEQETILTCIGVTTTSLQLHVVWLDCGRWPLKSFAHFDLIDGVWMRRADRRPDASGRLS